MDTGTRHASGKSGHEAQVINGNIYIFGGSSAAVRVPLTTVEVYGTVEAPQSVDPVGKLLETWEQSKQDNSSPVGWVKRGMRKNLQTIRKILIFNDTLIEKDIHFKSENGTYETVTDNLRILVKKFSCFLQIFLTFTQIVGIINTIRTVFCKFVAIFLTFARTVGIIKG